MTHAVFPFRLTWRHIFIALGIVFIALALRFWMLYEQAGLNLDFVPVADDPLTYYSRANGVLAGTFPVKAFDGTHPGLYYWYAFLMFLVGSSVTMLHLALALVDSIAVGFLIGSAWLLTKRASAGYFAGLLLAIYPPAIFYGTNFLTEGTAHSILILISFFLLWQREKVAYWQSIFLGLLFGALFVTRGNLAPIAGLWALWFWFRKESIMQGLTHIGLAALLALALVLPFTWWNYSASGHFQVLTTTPDFQFYSANNRDANGLGGGSVAYSATDIPYWDALRRDLAVAPEHFWGLVIRRIALHWSLHEPGNTISYERLRDSGFVLRLVPFNFMHIAFLGLLGWRVLAFTDRKLALFFGSYFLWLTFMMAISFAISRLRYPIVNLLILLAACAFAYVWDMLREKRFKHKIRDWALPLILIIALLALPFFIITPTPPLPIKRSYSALPPDAMPMQVSFGNGELELVGWRNFPEWWPASTQGWMRQGEAYAIELFWRVPTQATQPYNFYLAYIDDNLRFAGVDQPIGGVSFPAFTTEKWQAGVIYSEIVSFLPKEPLALADSGQIRLGVWYWDSEGLITSVPLDSGEASLLIQTMAVFNPELSPEIANLPPSDLVFGETIALRGYSIPETAQTGETVILRFTWEALREINTDYQLFLHVVDESGEIATQGDNNPVLALFTNNWMPNYPLLGELPLTMPDTAGTYQIYGGLYNENGRLSVDAPDNRVFLGEIVVE